MKAHSLVEAKDKTSACPFCTMTFKKPAQLFRVSSLASAGGFQSLLFLVSFEGFGQLLLSFGQLFRGFGQLFLSFVEIIRVIALPWNLIKKFADPSKIFGRHPWVRERS